MVQISMPFKDLLPLCNEGGSQGTSPFVGNPPKVDAGARGLRSPSYRDGDGYGLCTESLGSESSCDGSVGDADEIASLMTTVEYEGNALPSRTRRKEGEGRGGRRDFPPPLSSLVHVGATRRRSFVRGVRHDGRLVLTQVTVESPRIFHACRRDGRLQLHLARHRQAADDGDGMEEEMEAREFDDDEEEGEEEVVEEEVELRKEQQDVEARKEQVEDVHVTTVAWNKEQVEEEEEEEEGVKVALKPSSWQWVQEGCYNRRCHDVPTGGGGGGSAAGGLPLFWSNPQFMTRA